jgi:hypothetical protein
VALSRGIEGSDPIRPDPIGRLDGTYELRRDARFARIAVGTLACPRCDAPVALDAGPAAPSDAISCPFCDHGAFVRDFLSLASPTRPARVEVRIGGRRTSAA